MRTNWLKVGVILAVVGAVALLRSERSQPLRPQSATSALHEEKSEDARGGLPSRLELTRAAEIDAERHARPQRVFRDLHARRPPEIEADPQFQKLLEIDSARKMALLENDPEELKRVRQQLLADAAIPRHVLEAALLDPNPEVRLAALYEIGLAMAEPPLELLAPVVQGDPDAEVRLEALSMIVEIESEEADALIEGALDDPDAAVSDEAQEIIEARIDDLSM